jgi:hypothetical protein
MWRRLALMVALGWALALGCTPVQKVASTSWLPGRQPFQGPTGSDVVELRVALLQVRPGEAEWKYVNGELWQLADESLIDEDRRDAMGESGFRVGRLGTQPPPALLALLTSRRFNPSPRDISFRTGDDRPLAVGPTLPHCRYRTGSDAEPVALDQADCKLVVTATRGPDGKTVLRVAPEVQSGDAKNVYRVDKKAGSFLSQPERPTKSYPHMGWEAELARNEYLIVGGSYERSESLGHQFFVRPDESPPVQRLLVIQMGATQQQTPLPAPAPPSGGSAARSAPLALQTARGTAP